MQLLLQLSDGTNGFLLSLAIFLDGCCFPKAFESVREAKEELAKEIEEKKKEKRKESDDKGVAEWISIILCLLPSPLVIMFLLIVAGAIREAWHITNFLAITLCTIVGLILYLLLHGF